MCGVGIRISSRESETDVSHREARGSIGSTAQERAVFFFPRASAPAGTRFSVSVPPSPSLSFPVYLSLGVSSEKQLIAVPLIASSSHRRARRVARGIVKWDFSSRSRDRRRWVPCRANDGDRGAGARRIFYRLGRVSFVHEALVTRTPARTRNGRHVRNVKFAFFPRGESAGSVRFSLAILSLSTLSVFRSPSRKSRWKFRRDEIRDGNRLCRILSLRVPR